VSLEFHREVENCCRCICKRRAHFYIPKPCTETQYSSFSLTRWRNLYWEANTLSRYQKNCILFTVSERPCPYSETLGTYHYLKANRLNDLSSTVFTSAVVPKCFIPVRLPNKHSFEIYTSTYCATDTASFILWVLRNFSV
jgi:hypothetical protein